MKKFQRFLILALAFVMVAALFSGCASDSETPQASKAPGVSSTPSGSDNADTEAEPITYNGYTAPAGWPLGEGITFTYWESLFVDCAPYTSDYGESSYFWQTIEALSGIDIKFIQPVSSSESEQFSVMLASGDYPDIIKTNVAYPNGYDAAIEDEILVDMAKYVNSVMPNYSSLLDKYDVWSDCTTDSGYMPFITQIRSEPLTPYLTGHIRGDWLEDLGLGLPETFDDWHNTLKAFKDSKTNGAGPLQWVAAGTDYHNFWEAGYGVTGTGAYFMKQVDGVVKFTADTDAFKAYLQMANTWYTEGLLDPDFASATGFGPTQDRIYKNETGAYTGYWQWAGQHWAELGAAEEGAWFALCPYPTINKGDEIKIGTYCSNTDFYGFSVSTACQYPEIAAKMIDWNYSEDGSLLANYGVEGVTFEYDANGKPQYTDLIAKNENKISLNAAANMYLCGGGAILYIQDREKTLKGNEEASKWMTLYAGDYEEMLPSTLTYTSDEGAERAAILTDVQTYVNEMAVKFIIGVELFDKWDSYCAQLDTMNIDRAVEISQAALDRYSKRSN